MNILVSACLLGVNCRYDGTGKLADGIQELMKYHSLIPVCPEILGGLATPRPAAEIQGSRVITNINTDVTEQYERGAREVLRLAKLYDCNVAILKERSPSCGHDKIYDGTFQGKLVPGNGKAADLLIQNQIKVYGESDLPELLKEIESQIPGIENW